MKVILNPKTEFDSPVDLDNITPDRFTGKSAEEMEKTPLFKGSKKIELKEIFELEIEETENSEVEIIVAGDIPKGKRLGQDMSEGKIKVEGDVGKYAGAFMSGGEIEIEGDADSWAGQKMSGGEITIKGEARDFIGSTYRGEWEGVTGGKITVEGNVGDQIAEWLDGGRIEVNGNVGLHPAFHMKSGTVIIRGDSGERVGGQMKGGNIVIMGSLKEVLPGFSFEEEVKNIDLDGEEVDGEFLKFTGDKAEDGNGSLFLAKAKNEHFL